MLDTGVRYFHKDLGGSNASLSNPTAVEGNMWINLAEKNGTPGIDDDGPLFNPWDRQYVDDWIGWDFVDDPCGPPGPFLCYPCCCFDGEDCLDVDNDPRDFHGHGTHCAGNISAINNNEFATASPAGGWGNWYTPPFGNGVKVMALRIGWNAVYVLFEAGMVGMDYAAEALYYAANNGAKIASCSWGSDDSGGIGAAIDYFVGNGGLIFKAAGNDGTETADYLCARDDVLCVAATDQTDCKASFSTYGTWVDLSAPGVQVGSLWHSYSDPVNDYVNKLDGTSMATPLAASVAALIWSRDPDLSADQVQQYLFASADPIDGLLCNSSFAGKLGAGRINAFQAVLSVGTPPPPFSDFTGTPITGDAPLTVNFTDASTGSVDSWAWDFGDGGTSTAQNPSYTYTAAGTYTVALTVTGPGGSDTNTKADYINVTSLPPAPVADFTGSPITGDAPLTVAFTDQSTNATSWSWDFGDGFGSTLQNPTYTYNAAATYTVSLTAAGEGGSDSETKVDYITVTSPPPPPPIAEFSGTPTSGNAPLAVSFSDSSTGGEATSWSWDFGDGGTSTAQNPTYTYNAAGTYTVSLTAAGPGGSDIETKVDYITVNTATTPSVGVSEPPITGRYGTFGRGKNKSTEFIPTSVFSRGNEVIIRATVTDSGGAVPGAIVVIGISGPEETTLTSGPSDSNGIAEAKWKTSAPKGKKGGTQTGDYTATVTDVTASGYVWDEIGRSTTFTVE
jgi:PKD repeat protein